MLYASSSHVTSQPCMHGYVICRKNVRFLLAVQIFLLSPHLPSHPYLPCLPTCRTHTQKQYMTHQLICKDLGRKAVCVCFLISHYLLDCLVSRQFPFLPLSHSLQVYPAKPTISYTLALLWLHTFYKCVARHNFIHIGTFLATYVHNFIHI